MLSVGRDKVISFWDLQSGALLHTAPVFDQLEAAVLLKPGTPIGQEVVPDDDWYVAVGGDKGLVTIWSGVHRKQIASLELPRSIDVDKSM